MRPWLTRAGRAAVWLVALSFAVGALTKFASGDTFFGPPYAEKFVQWGFPAWFRFVVGAAEGVAAVLLVSPRWRFVGCLILLPVLVGAITTHIIHRDPLAMAAAAPVMLMVVAAIAYAAAPMDLRRPWVPRPPAAASTPPAPR